MKKAATPDMKHRRRVSQWLYVNLVLIGLESTGGKVGWHLFSPPENPRMREVREREGLYDLARGVTSKCKVQNEQRYNELSMVF